MGGLAEYSSRLIGRVKITFKVYN